MMRKRIAALALALAVLMSMAVRVCAQELPDETRPGSLTIRLSFDGEPLEGGALTVTQVGAIRITDGNAGFVLVDQLTGGPSLDNLDDLDLAARLAELAREKDLESRRAEIVDGRAVFEDLMPGLYVVTQSPADVTDGFDAIRPFLLSLPQWINDTYVYDLTAAPKVPLETEPTEPTEPSEPTEPTEPSEPDEPGTPIIPELPQTGQLNWPVPILTLTGLFCFTVGWTLCFRNRREPDEA